MCMHNQRQPTLHRQLVGDESLAKLNHSADSALQLKIHFAKLYLTIILYAPQTNMDAAQNMNIHASGGLNTSQSVHVCSQLKSMVGTHHLVTVQNTLLS